MIFISFGRWSGASGKWFRRERIYAKGYKWTPFVKVMRRRKDLVKTMRDMRDVQGWDGNWNCSPYMHGLYNGMEYMLAMAEGREPDFREKPEIWLDDIDKGEMKIAAEQ